MTDYRGVDGDKYYKIALAYDISLVPTGHMLEQTDQNQISCKQTPSMQLVPVRACGLDDEKGG